MWLLATQSVASSVTWPRTEWIRITEHLGWHLPPLSSLSCSFTFYHFSYPWPTMVQNDYTKHSKNKQRISWLCQCHFLRARQDLAPPCTTTSQTPPLSSVSIQCILPYLVVVAFARSAVTISRLMLKQWGMLAILTHQEAEISLLYEKVNVLYIKNEKQNLLRLMSLVITRRALRRAQCCL